MSRSAGAWPAIGAPVAGSVSLTGLVLDVDSLALGAEHQRTVLQGADDRRGPRAAAGGDFADAGEGFVEIVCRKMREGLSEARRAGRYGA